MRGRLIVAVLLWGFSAGAWCDQTHQTLWTVKGDHNTVYLLGSVHLLKASDSALSPETLRVYERSKALVLEIKLGEASADKLLGSILDLETLPAGKALADVLGPDVYGKFTARARPLGLDPELISHFQPWFAMAMLEQLRLAQLGFDPNAGIDRQLAMRALADHKEIVGLETPEDQFTIFANLSIAEQRSYVLHSLEEMDRATNTLDEIISAWRSGDTKTFELLQVEVFKEYPDLYSKLVTDRNQKWLPKIAGLLKEDDDYLVVVGALHLVGNDGIVQLLEMKGYEVVQH